MGEEKTYVFGESNNNLLSSLIPLLKDRGIDPGMLALMKNNGFGDNGSWFIWLLFILIIWGRNGWGNNGNFNNQLNNDFGRDILLQAINGNGNAISQLASTLNCDMNTVQTGLSNLMSGIQSGGNQVGMSGQQIINSIQAGNCELANQVSQCCCKVNESITKANYENQIATLNQTNSLSGKMDANTNTLAAQLAAQTTFLSDKFCDLEKRELQNRIDTLREERSTLQNTISNGHQTAQIQSYIGSIVSPLANKITEIESKLPQTVTLPYSCATAVPTSMLYNGYFPYNNGSIWA